MSADLFVLGDFTMHSGDIGHWKIECDALTDDDIKCLAFMLVERLPAFDRVIGVPRGGLRLEHALAFHATPGARRTLIVDDVLTTGSSMERAREGVRSERASEVVHGAVIFARGECLDWVTPLFTLASGESGSETE